jgi:hypothetical protein
MYVTPMRAPRFTFKTYPAVRQPMILVPAIEQRQICICKLCLENTVIHM